MRSGSVFLTFLNCVFLNVSSNGLHDMMHNHIGHICLTFPYCAISNVSLNCQHERKHNHIVCICATFLHRAFSNIYGDRLPERKHNHIACICATFLWCVSSNVSSNEMQSHIGYICLTFLHCVFLNVSSNGLHERMHNHLGYICLTFPTVRFQMCPQIAFLRWCIITLVAFVWLFSTVFSNVPSTHLQKSMLNHTGGIFLTFHFCVLSHVCFYVFCTGRFIAT